MILVIRQARYRPSEEQDVDHARRWFGIQYCCGMDSPAGLRRDIHCWHWLCESVPEWLDHALDDAFLALTSPRRFVGFIRARRERNRRYRTMALED